MQTRMRHLALLFLATFLMMALGTSLTFGVGSTPLVHAATSTPTLIPSKNTVHAGEIITVAAQGFAADDTVNLFLDQTVNSIATLTCDTNGNCAGSLTVPLFSGPQGQHMLLAQGSQPGESIANTPLMINPALLFDSSQGGVSRGGPGTGTELSGYSFQLNETVSVYWGDANGTLLGTATSDNYYGYFHFPFTTPANLAPGKYEVTVVRSGQKPATLTITFTVVPPKLTGPAGVRSGHVLNVHLKGFQGVEQVVFSWNANGGQQIGTFQTQGDGSLFTNYSLRAPSAPDGSYTLTATGESSGLQASMPLNVGPGVQVNTPVNPGGTLNVSGGGFAAGEVLTVYIVDHKSSGISVTTAADGSFQATLTIPLSLLPAPEYHVAAINSDGSEKGETFFSIAPPSINWTGNQNNIAAYGSAGTINGQYFPANEQVTLYWNYQQAGQVITGTVTAAADGSFSFDLTTPSSPFTGNATIEAIAATRTFAASFQVQTQAAIFLSPTSALVGQTVTVNGGSFTANATVTVTLAVNGSSAVVGITTTDNTGAFTTSFSIPLAQAGGLSAVSASDGTIGATTKLVVQIPLSLTPATGGGGTSITVQTPNLNLSNVECFLNQIKIVGYDPITGKSQVLSQTCPLGAFSVTVTAPASLVSGQSYQIELLMNGYLVGQATFTAQ